MQCGQSTLLLCLRKNNTMILENVQVTLLVDSLFDPSCFLPLHFQLHRFHPVKTHFKKRFKSTRTKQHIFSQGGRIQVQSQGSLHRQRNCFILNDKKGAKHLALFHRNKVLQHYDLNKLLPHSGVTHHANIGWQPGENCQQKPQWVHSYSGRRLSYQQSLCHSKLV